MVHFMVRVFFQWIIVIHIRNSQPVSYTYSIYIYIYIYQAAPCLRWFVSGLSPQKPGFNLRPVCVEFLVDRVTLDQVLILPHCSIFIRPSPKQLFDLCDWQQC